MKKVRCICYELHVNRTQKRFLLHHIQEVQRIYQDMSKRLQSNTVYTKADIYAQLKEHHRYYLKYMNEIEVHDLIVAILKFHTHPKGKRKYNCLIGSDELIFRGIRLESLSKFPLIYKKNNVCFVRLRYTKHRFLLCLCLKKSYKNDGKGG